MGESASSVDDMLGRCYLSPGRPGIIGVESPAATIAAFVDGPPRCGRSGPDRRPTRPESDGERGGNKVIIHMYSAGMDEDGRVVIGRPGDAIEVPIGQRSCGAPIGYPCTCQNCVTGSEAAGSAAEPGAEPGTEAGAGAESGRGRGTCTAGHESEYTEYAEHSEYCEESGSRS